MLRLPRALLLLVSLLAALGLLARTEQSRRPHALTGVVDRTREAKYRTDRVLVRFRPGTSREAMAAAHGAAQGKVLREFQSVERLQVVGLSQGVSVQAALHQYRQNPGVLYAEPDYIVTTL